MSHPLARAAWGVALALLVALCVPLHILGVLSMVTEARAMSPPGSHLRFVSASYRARIREEITQALPASAVGIAGAAVCLVAALTHRHIDPGFFGFLPRIGVAWYVGLALVLAALVLGLDRPYARAVPVFLLVAVLTLTPATLLGLFFIQRYRRRTCSRSRRRSPTRWPPGSAAPD